MTGKPHFASQYFSESFFPLLIQEKIEDEKKFLPLARFNGKITAANIALPKCHDRTYAFNF